jgi:hypothetical protein
MFIVKVFVFSSNSVTLIVVENNSKKERQELKRGIKICYLFMAFNLGLCFGNK